VVAVAAASKRLASFAAGLLLGLLRCACYYQGEGKKLLPRGLVGGGRGGGEVTGRVEEAGRGGCRSAGVLHFYHYNE